MISALKRLAKKGEEPKVNCPGGVAVLSPSMQKKFSRGVQYNMKIVIKGDRNTGKSCLLTRLQGGAFREEYIPTQEIQAACINWNYRESDEVVKVEVWDIVDRAKKRSKSNSLKVTHEEPMEVDSDEVALDAEFVDIYKGTHGVIMLLDITKSWTWTYIERELIKVPPHLPVLVMANFRDMGSHRVVDEDRILAYIEHLERPPGSAEIYYTESSLKNGFGLRYIYRFLNMPFLILQRETLLRHLEANALEIEDYRESLFLNRESEDQNYDLFVDLIEKKTSSRIKSPKQDSEKSPEVIMNGHGNDKKNQELSPVSQSPVGSPEIVPVKLEPSKTSSQNSRHKEIMKDSSGDVTLQSKLTVTGEAKSIDDFQIHEKLDPTFLGEAPKKIGEQFEEIALESSDEEDGHGNPLVEDYQDLSSADEDPPKDAYRHVDEIPKQESFELEPEIESAVDTVPSSTSDTVSQPKDISSSEEDTGAFEIAGNIDIDSDVDDNAQAPAEFKKGDSSSNENPTDLNVHSNEQQISLAGLDDFVAEQLGKATITGKTDSDTKCGVEEGSELKESKKKKKKGKKSKQTDEDGDKPKKKKKKPKDGVKKKKKSDAGIETENGDYELL